MLIQCSKQRKCRTNEGKVEALVSEDAIRADICSIKNAVLLQLAPVLAPLMCEFRVIFYV